MTPAEFDHLAAKTRQGPLARRMARRVLVDGITAAQAAREDGRTRAEASRAAARIRAELRRETAAPNDWRVLTVVVPPDLAATIEQLARTAAAAGRKLD